MRHLPCLGLLFSLVLTGCAASSTSQGAIAPEGSVNLAPSVAGLPLAAGVLLNRWETGQRHNEVFAVDPTTGRAIPGASPVAASSPIVSADGRKLVAVESHGQSCEADAGGERCYGTADLLHLLDLHTWQDVTAPLSAHGWVGPLVFRPDAARLALIEHEQAANIVLVLDSTTGKVIARRAIDFRPSLLAFTRDGMRLLAYGQPLGVDPGMVQPGPPCVLVMDAMSLDVQWEQSLPAVVSGEWCQANCNQLHESQVFAFWTPAVVFAAGGSKLFIVHADADRLTTVDLSARTVRTVDIRSVRSWWEQLLARTAGVAEAKGNDNGAVKTAVLAPDGQRLFLLGRTIQALRDSGGAWQTTSVSLGLHVITVGTGKDIARSDSAATAIGITPDGTRLLLTNTVAGAEWTDVLATNGLQRLAHLAGWQVVAGRRIDGQPLLLASRPGQQATQLAVLDPQSLSVVHPWTLDGYATWVSRS